MVANPKQVDTGGGATAPGTRASNGRLLLALAGAIAFTAAVLFIADRSGGTLLEPVGALPWELGVTAIAVVIVCIGIIQSFQQGKLSRVLLVAVSSGTSFWQETYGDWGTYLLYSPAFAQYEWGDTIWTSPVRCWWFIAGYVFFYTTFLYALEKTFYFARDRWPSANPYLATTLLAFPTFYTFDLALEGAAHGFGWWHYQYAFGPSMAVGDGRFPLLWPILEQVPFMVLAVFAMTWRNARGEDVFDLIARVVLRRPPGQIAILASWIVTVNLAFLTTTILPLMALRWLAGPASATVP